MAIKTQVLNPYASVSVKDSTGKQEAVQYVSTTTAKGSVASAGSGSSGSSGGGTSTSPQQAMAAQPISPVDSIQQQKIKQAVRALEVQGMSQNMGQISKSAIAAQMGQRLTPQLADAIQSELVARGYNVQPGESSAPVTKEWLRAYSASAPPAEDKGIAVDETGKKLFNIGETSPRIQTLMGVDATKSATKSVSKESPMAVDDSTISSNDYSTKESALSFYNATNSIMGETRRVGAKVAPDIPLISGLFGSLAAGVAASPAMKAASIAEVDVSLTPVYSRKLNEFVGGLAQPNELINTEASWAAFQKADAKFGLYEAEIKPLSQKQTDYLTKYGGQAKYYQDVKALANADYKQLTEKKKFDVGPLGIGFDIAGAEVVTYGFFDKKTPAQIESELVTKRYVRRANLVSVAGTGKGAFDAEWMFATPEAQFALRPEQFKEEQIGLIQQGKSPYLGGISNWLTPRVGSPIGVYEKVVVPKTQVTTQIKDIESKGGNVPLQLQLKRGFYTGVGNLPELALVPLAFAGGIAAIGSVSAKAGMVAKGIGTGLTGVAVAGVVAPALVGEGSTAIERGTEFAMSLGILGGSNLAWRKAFYPSTKIDSITIKSGVEDITLSMRGKGAALQSQPEISVGVTEYWRPALIDVNLGVRSKTQFTALSNKWSITAQGKATPEISGYLSAKDIQGVKQTPKGLFKVTGWNEGVNLPPSDVFIDVGGASGTRTSTKGGTTTDLIKTSYSAISKQPKGKSTVTVGTIDTFIRPEVFYTDVAGSKLVGVESIRQFTTAKVVGKAQGKFIEPEAPGYVGLGTDKSTTVELFGFRKYDPINTVEEGGYRYRLSSLLVEKVTVPQPKQAFSEYPLERLRVVGKRGQVSVSVSQEAKTKMGYDFSTFDAASIESSRLASSVSPAEPLAISLAKTTKLSPLSGQYKGLFVGTGAESVYGPKSGIKSNLNFKPLSDYGTISGIKPMTGMKVIQSTPTKIIPATKTKTGIKTIQDIDLVQGLKLVPPTSLVSSPPIPPIPKIPPPPYVYPFGFDFGFPNVRVGKIGNRKVKKGTKYTPDFVAVVLGQFTRKSPSENRYYSGEERRYIYAGAKPIKNAFAF